MNSESMSKKIVWDLDGTLFDTWETHCEAIRKTYRRIYDADISMAKLICSQAACLIDTIWNIFKDNYMEALLLYQDMFIALVSANKLEDKIKKLQEQEAQVVTKSIEKQKKTKYNRDEN